MFESSNKKKWLVVLALFGLAAAPAAPYIFSWVQQAYFTNQNLLANPGFESGTINWSASGGVYATTSTAANVGAGARSGDWDSGSAGETLTSNSVPITSGSGYSNANFAGYCAFKVASGTATHKLQLYDGTNILNSVTIPSTTSGFSGIAVNAISPASGTISLRVISVASNEPEIFIDNCYLGLAANFNLSGVSQTKFIGSAFFATTGSCTWTRTGTSLGAFSTTSACPGPTVEFNPGPGTIQTTDADLPQITLNNAPSGVYQIIASGRTSAGNASGRLDFAINDGTTTSGRASEIPSTSTDGFFSVVGWFNYTAPGNHTFALYGAASTSTVAIANADGNAETYFSIIYYPNGSQTAYTPAQFPASWSGYQSGVSGGCSTSSASFADPSACTNIALTQVTARNMTCTQSGTGPAISCNLPRGGMFRVDATVVLTGSTTSTVSSRIVDGSAAIIDPGLPIVFISGLATNAEALPLSGHYLAAGQGAVVFKAQLATNAGTASITAGGPSPQLSVKWLIQDIDSNSGTPFLVGSVTSNSNTSQYRIESVAFGGNSSLSSVCTTGSCTIASATGGISGVTWTATGRYSIAFNPGTFSAAPISVQCSTSLNLANTFTYEDSFSSWTSTLAKVGSVSTANAATNESMICTITGPR